MKVSDLAKSLGTTSKEVIAAAAELGTEGLTASNKLSEEMVVEISAQFEDVEETSDDTVVVHRGDKVREPTDEEKFAREMSKPIPGAEVGVEGVEGFLRTTVKHIKNLRANRRRWQQTSVMQRYAMLGAMHLAQEALNEQEGGRTVSFTRYLGMDPKTGTVAATA